MKLVGVFLVVTLLASSVALAVEDSDNTLVARWWNSIFKRSSAVEVHQDDDVGSVGGVVEIDDIRVRPWAFGSKKVEPWCAALRGVAEDFFNAPMYMRELDANSDGVVTKGDLVIMESWYNKRADPAVQRLCRNLLMRSNSATIFG